MKFNVNSTVSILSDSNSTLELFNGTNATVAVDVSNASILSQITTSDKSLPTNATRTVQLEMSTKENIGLNEDITKPTVLSQNITSLEPRRPTTVKQPFTNVFPETTNKIKEKTFQTTRETKESTSEFPTSMRSNLYKKSMSSDKVSKTTEKSTISTTLSLTKQQNQNVSTKPFTIKETTEYIKKPQSTLQASTTTRTTTTTASTITTKLSSPLQSTTNQITNTEISLKMIKTTEKNKITTRKPIEISDPSTKVIKPLIEKATPKIINSKTANIIHRKSTKAATKHYRKSPEISTLNSINSTKYSKITAEKVVKITNKIKLKSSTPVSTNRRYWKTISKTPFQKLLKNDSKQNISTKNPAVAYGGYKIPTTSHFLNSQYTIDNANMDSTTEPNITMGAGPLVIVVLLPFLALFLIAVVTALRRKMKKSRRRILRVQSRDLDNTSERNQSQMIPLTKPEANE